MKEEYLILLDPALSVSAEELSTAWGEVPECGEAGEILFGPELGKRTSFAVDPASLVIGALIASGAGLAKDLIMTLIKRALERADKAEAKEVHVTTEADPQTGLPVFRVSRKG